MIGAANKVEVPAETNMLFKSPDLVRTGQASRVELTAKDRTITRIGANTVFTFAQGGRDIQLHEGSVLFHSPKGAGGGAIKNRGTSAAVLGTTEIATVLRDGSFKVMDLEGHVKVTLKNGLSVVLGPGQTLTVSADGTRLGEVQNFDLGAMAASLELVSGFVNTLSSLPQIESAAQEQNRQIAEGSLTNLISSDIAGFGLEVKSQSAVGSPAGSGGDWLSEFGFRQTRARGLPSSNSFMGAGSLGSLPSRPVRRTAAPPAPTPSTPVATVTNLGQPSSSSGYDVHGAQCVGMSFTVGSDYPAWTLDSLELRLFTTGTTAHDLAVKLHADAAGMIGATIGSFSGPEPGVGEANYAFNPDMALVLVAGKTYWITASSLSGGYSWRSTAGSIAETGLAGWTIGDGLVFGNVPGVDCGPNASLYPAMFAVQATGMPIVPEPTTALTLTLVLAGFGLARRR